MDFDAAFDALLLHEGGLSLDNRDRGNWTSGIVGVGELRGSKYGISAREFPTLDIQNISVDQAKEIYRKQYWNPLQLDKMPETIRFDLFDTAVNSGVSRAVKLLQETVGAIRDGRLGPGTIAKVQEFDPIRLKAHFNAYRLKFLTLVPAWESQSRGWVRRIANNLIR